MAFSNKKLDDMDFKNMDLFKREEKPIIVFSKLRGFPTLKSNPRIKTEWFLDASKEVVSKIDEVGAIFRPVIYDMNRNIHMINKIYKMKQEEYRYLDDLILGEVKITESPIPDCVLWLKRGLELVERFLRNILEDATRRQNLHDHLKDAYVATLQQYHGPVLQRCFEAFYKLLPRRTKLIGKGPAFLKLLDAYLFPMRTTLQELNIFYDNNNLNHSNLATTFYKD